VTTSSPATVFRDDALLGETAVVTGGGSGIGLAIAKAFVAAGAEVVITSRSADRLAAAELEVAAATGRQCASFPCDVRDEDAVAALHDFVLARSGPVSVVVNNAAANFRTPAARMTRRALQTVVDVDVFGTFNVTREFLPDMVAAQSGVVLSITVPFAERGFPQFSHMGAAKAAVTSLTCSWAREWGPDGIRANAIAPGMTPTPGVTTNMLGRDAAATAEAFADQRWLVPLGRLGYPADIAAASVFLCSPAARWITGVTLTVDGGSYLPIGP
jgi:NAD(P)-dependent dehydrogenase (short-subunit alcohol dehydrogenase family)